jgi:microsomal epoxide hydrolase
MRRPDGMKDEHLNAYELEGIEKLNKFISTGAGYATEHGTRPSTIGHVLSTSPMALLAWLVVDFKA